MSQPTRRSASDDPNGSKKIDYAALHGKRVRVTYDYYGYISFATGVLHWSDSDPWGCTVGEDCIRKEHILSIEEVEE